jgi:small nuclear ribonucleoprotein (snRNP)-like protein
MSRLHRSLRRFDKRRVQLGTKTGKSYEGFLERVFGDCVTLTAAVAYLSESEPPRSIDGEVVILRENIDLIQILN